MTMLVPDLLAYTQLDKQTSPVAHISAERALGHVLADMRGAIEETRAEITFDSLPPVCID